MTVKKNKTLQIIESLQSFHQFGELKDSPNMTIEWIGIDLLKSGKYQPRRHFDEIALQELSDSIKEHGILQPILVRLSDNLYQDEYEIIAGERRYLAAEKAGLASVPCIIKQITEEKTALLALIENLQREDLNVLEEARAFCRLKQEFDYTDEMIAQMVQKSRTTITNKIRLLKLSDTILDFVMQKTLSEGQARSLIGLDEIMQLHFAAKVIEFKWSVRYLEEQIQWFKQHGTVQDIQVNTAPLNETIVVKKPTAPITVKQSKDFLILQEQLCEFLQSTVQLKLNPKTQKGRIIIDFSNLEGLQGLLYRINYDTSQN